MPDITPLGVTMGEPAGIGPEVVIKAWQTRKSHNLSPFFLIGAIGALKAHRLSCPVERIDHPSKAVSIFPHALPVFDIQLAHTVKPGQIDQSNAAMVVEAIDKAGAWAMNGEISGIVTGPIQKNALYAAGFKDPGHTEYLARLAGLPPEHSVMMLAVPGLRVVPLSVHIPLKDVSDSITQDRLFHVLRILHHALKTNFNIDKPHIAVAGLNPHAGEDGSIGREEIEVITPALDRLRAQGLSLSGPLPADSLFHEDARKTYDAVLCMYHDQALIPLKTLDFHHGVNITLGLPFIRTSPDHGTALDISGKNLARPDSMIAAIELAQHLSRSGRDSLS